MALNFVCVLGDLPISLDLAPARKAWRTEGKVEGTQKGAGRVSYKLSYQCEKKMTYQCNHYK